MLIAPTVSDNILSALIQGPLTLDELRRVLSQASYAGLRFQLARLEERGIVQRNGMLYRLVDNASTVTDAHG